MKRYWAALLPALAASLAFARWLAQGSKNIYTDANRSFYVPDEDLGWRLIHDGPPWLGLDAVMLLVGFTAAIATASWLLARHEDRAKTKLAKTRVVLSLAGFSSLVVPVWALAGGGRPERAVDRPPLAVISVPRTGVVAGLDLPAGTYQALAAKSSLAATLVAGGEEFEARFPDLASGAWRGDPRDLTQPMSATFAFKAASVQTGIELRDKHAREKLKVEEFPNVSFRLEGVTSASAEGAALVVRGHGRVSLIGRDHTVDITARVKTLDKAARARLQILHDSAMLVDAALSLSLPDTAVGNDGTFDQNLVPIRARLLLVQKDSKHDI